MIGLRSSVPGTPHQRIVGVDLAKKPEDAKQIALIDRVDEPQYSKVKDKTIRCLKIRLRGMFLRPSSR